MPAGHAEVGRRRHVLRPCAPADPGETVEIQPAVVPVPQSCQGTISTSHSCSEKKPRSFGSCIVRVANPGGL